MATSKKKQAKNKDAVVAAEIGAAVVAAGAAAAAGYYFYASKGARRHRKAAAAWARGMKAEVLKEAKKVQSLDKKTAASIVDAAAAAYMGARNVDPGDLKAAARELKVNWRELEKELATAGTAAKRATKKSAKKAGTTAKKAAKKAR